MNHYNTITLITLLFATCLIMACVMIGKDNE